MNKKKIIIGTAQFGMKYGISNISGKTKKNQIKKMLLYGKKKKLRYLDTSSNYGNAENILGKFKLNNWQIITKYKTDQILVKKGKILENLIRLIEKSKKRLRVKKIYAILLNNPDLILNKCGKELYESLKKVKKMGLISNFGYSIYNFSNLKKICKNFKPDIIQCPYNVFDRRLVTKNYLSFLKKKKIEIHVRSIFLQGLLLLPIKKLPKLHKKRRKIFVNWERWLFNNKLEPVDACLNFALQNKEIDKIVLGFNNLTHLKKIFTTKLNNKLIFPKNILSNNQKLINPNLW